MTDTVLHKGKFVELRLREAEDYKYEYLHEARCDGNIVAILPYNVTGVMGLTTYLLRHEFTPCWGDSLNVSSITGGWEKKRHPTPIDTVIEELREEAGIVLKTERSIRSLGTCRGTKSSDTLYHLFAVDLSLGYEEVEIEGDGGSLEAKAHNVWYHNELEILEYAQDPMVFALYGRLKAKLDRKISRDDYLNIR
jgi:8-oxo-dGTP pyrophosphatase MutT (NUDIX family)